MALITGPLRQRATRHFAGLNVLREDDANTFGIESRTAFQVRGNGTLALTADELLFAQWVPNRLLRIPRAAITEVTTTKSWLGKTMGRQLLLVRWTADTGADAIALWVKDLEGWMAVLSAPREGAPASP
jgi:hypothetical protein